MQERRRRQRLPSIRLTAHVRIKRGLLGRDWVTVRVLDFSNQGIAFTGEVPLSEGDRFHMSLTLHTETGDFVVEKAAVRMANVRDLQERRIFGAHFVDDNPPAVIHSLEQIEGIVTRYKELSSRIVGHRPDGTPG